VKFSCAKPRLTLSDFLDFDHYHLFFDKAFYICILAIVKSLTRKSKNGTNFSFAGF